MSKKTLSHRAVGRLGWVLSWESDLCLITFEAIVWRKVSRDGPGGREVRGGWSNRPIQLVNHSVNKPLWSPTFYARSCAGG